MAKVEEKGITVIKLGMDTGSDSSCSFKVKYGRMRWRSRTCMKQVCEMSEMSLRKDRCGSTGSHSIIPERNSKND